MVFECYREFIPGFESFNDALDSPAPVCLRLNSLRREPAAIARSLRQRGLTLERAHKDDECLYVAPFLKAPGNLVEYYLGHLHPQALTSCLVALALSPAAHSYVLDMCAAPGGKTSQLAQLMRNTGLIVANELNTHRHIPLGHTLNRLGVLNTIVTAYQAQEFPLRHSFDHVLADVPCSGEGGFRKPKECRFPLAPRQLKKTTQLQRRIILRGFDLLGEGGTMVYSTCTYNPAENESVVEYLLKNRPARLLPIKTPFPREPGIAGWRDHGPYAAQMQHAARFYPHHVNSVGFFMARIGRAE